MRLILIISNLTAAGCLIAVVVSLTGCDGSDSDDPRPVAGKVDVVASFYPLAEAARRVGGERVTVANLTPAGAEPHDLELSPDQVDNLEDAAVAIYIGGDFQPAVEEVVKRRKGRTLDLLEAVAPGSAGEDPHFWLDPRLMAAAVEATATSLIAADPQGEGTYRANAGKYRDELSVLDTEFEQGLAGCRRRDIVTSHEAFHYLAERYRLTQLAISGLSPETEPDPSRLAELADEVRRKQITTIFFEELVSPAVAETLARETGARAEVLSPIEGLTEEQADAGKDYVAVMRDNLASLRTALQCP